MRHGWAACILLIVVGLARPLAGQADAPADVLEVSAAEAYTWQQDDTTTLQLQGPVSIRLDKTTLTARNAVVWVTTIPGSVAGARLVEIALLEEARVIQPNGIERTARNLFIDARVRGPIRVSAAQRLTRDLSESELYQQAQRLRPMRFKGGEPSGQWIAQEQLPSTAPATQPTGEFRPQQPASITAGEFRTEKTPEGRIAAILTGGITLVQRDRDGGLIELLADRAVAFTPYRDLKEITPGARLQAIEQAVTGVYLEGDVRILRTPARRSEPDQRLSASRAFYDFTTDRAVLTDAVIQTTDLRSQLPLVVRARTIRQLSESEFSAEKVRLSTSTFATPSYSIGASSVYIRQSDVGNELTGTRTTFSARNATLDIGNVPVFYLPAIGGSITERMALREVETSSSSGFGFGLSTTWGLFETLGKLPPRGTDITYDIAYFTERGPALGLNGEYAGGFIDEATGDPWSYAGDFLAYGVFDEGEDDLGRQRRDVEPEDEFRGRVWWEHQHFFPDDWQLQLTAGYISDPTFLEEWANGDFRTETPRQTSLYLKRQRDSEAITFLTTFQPNDFVTVSDLYQEQFEVQRLPEIGYYRIGDSFWDDNISFFSANTASALDFNNSEYDLDELGFRPVRDGGFRSPGIPSLGRVPSTEFPLAEPWEAPDDTTFRADFREELTWPFSVAQFRAMPYVIGRYTQYSESLDGGSIDRLYAGAGFRLTTAFWRIDDTVESRLFDLHRLRHIIEPELHVYAGATNTQRDELLIYDEEIDAITETAAVQFALNQRWQTKRGGPGQWRSVDFFTLNIAYNHFFDEPPEAELNPADFRGLFFVSRPETSIARDSLNAEATWRLTDSTEIASNIYYNVEDSNLAAASIALSVQHDPRLSYYVALRHVGVDFIQTVRGNTFRFEDQDLLILALNYQLTSKYRLNLANSYDLAQDRNHRSALTLIRRFDRFYVALSIRVDRLQEQNAIFLNFWPEGVAAGGGTQSLRGFLGD